MIGSKYRDQVGRESFEHAGIHKVAEDEINNPVLPAERDRRFTSR